MGRLIARRLFALIPMLLIVSFVIFGLVAIVPGDAAVTLAGGVDAQPGAIERIRAEMGLDQSFFRQYLDWLSDAVRLDFGTSLYSQRPIADELFSRIPPTFGLIGLVLVLALVIAFCVGVAGGLRPGSLVDRLLLFGSSVSISLPSFWVALVLVVVFSVQLDLLPPFGYVALTESPWGWFQRMIMPAISLSMLSAAVLARQLRTGLAETMMAPFIRTAWAKGGTTRQVVLGHALKNSAIPVITVLGLQVGTLVGGSVLIEKIFSIPGLGAYMLSAVDSQDMPAVQAVAVLFVLLSVAVSLAVDISYGLLNPKVRAS